MKTKLFSNVFICILLLGLFAAPIYCYAQRGRVVIKAVEKLAPKVEKITEPAEKLINNREASKIATEEMSRGRTLPTLRSNGNISSGSQSVAMTPRRPSPLFHSSSRNLTGTDSRSAFLSARYAAEAAKQKKDEEERKKWLWIGGFVLLFGAGFYFYSKE